MKFCLFSLIFILFVVTVLGNNAEKPTDDIDIPPLDDSFVQVGGSNDMDPAQQERMFKEIMAKIQSIVDKAQQEKEDKEK